MKTAVAKDKKRLIRLLIVITVLIPIVDCLLFLAKAEIYLGFTGAFAYIDMFLNGLASGASGKGMAAVLKIAKLLGIYASGVLNAAILYFLPGMALTQLHFEERSKATLWSLIYLVCAVVRALVMILVFKFSSEVLFIVGSVCSVLLAALLVLVCRLDRRPGNYAVFVLTAILLVAGAVSDNPTASMRAYEKNIGDKYDVSISVTTSSVENKSYAQIVAEADKLAGMGFDATLYVQKAYKYIADKMDVINKGLGGTTVIGENKVPVVYLDSTGVPYFQAKAEAYGLQSAFETLDKLTGKGFTVTSNDASSVISGFSTFLINLFTYCAKFIFLVPIAILWLLCVKPVGISDHAPQRLHGFASAMCWILISVSVVAAIIMIIYTYISAVDVIEQIAVMTVIVFCVSSWLSAHTTELIAETTRATYTRQAVSEE